MKADIGDIHLIMGVLTPLGIAILMSVFKVLDTPSTRPMTTSEQYIRNSRNLLFNISFFAFLGWLIGFSLEFLITFMGSKLPQSKYIDAIWVLCSILFWRLWPQQLLYVPTTNSVFRTSNRIFTKKRELADDQGLVDNTVKYHGPIWAIINIFDQNQGEFDTESQENLKIPIKQLSFQNVTGSAEMILTYNINDIDAYAAGGTNNELRKKKVEQTVGAYLMNMVETAASKTTFLKAIADPAKTFGHIFKEFHNKAHHMETRHGIHIQEFKVSNLNASQAYNNALDARGITNVMIEQAQEAVKASKPKENEEPTIAFEKALELIIGTANPGGNVKVNLHRGLEGTKPVVDSDGNI